MVKERVATKADIPAGTVQVFEVNGVSIALANLDGENFYAIDNVCTHDGGPLGEGRLVNGTVECPRHGARFDVKTGAVRALPAVRPVKAYPVEVVGEEIRVEVNA
jgi:3-phenylpropionate/trans-cinnamate dioxygenase ferredoxin component